MAEMNSTPTLFATCHDEVGVTIRNRLPIWSCLIVIESAAGIGYQLLASGLSHHDAWMAGRHAMDTRDDVIGWRLRRDTQRLN